MAGNRHLEAAARNRQLGAEAGNRQLEAVVGRRVGEEPAGRLRPEAECDADELHRELHPIRQL